MYKGYSSCFSSARVKTVSVYKKNEKNVVITDDQNREFDLLINDLSFVTFYLL
jgi:hypothetical protein